MELHLMKIAKIVWSARQKIITASDPSVAPSNAQQQKERAEVLVDVKEFQK